MIRRAGGHTVALFLVSMTALAGVATVTSADAGGEQAKPLRCATILTSDELLKASGDNFGDVDAVMRAPGQSECIWIARSAKGAKSISLQFYEPTYIAETPSKTVPAFFKMMAEPTTGQKMEPLPGVGANAVLMTADPQLGAVVQLADGVAYLVTNNLTKAQVAAVARAAATP